MIDLLVGAPVWRRGWSLLSWFPAVERACDQVAMEPSYLFVVDPRDSDSLNVISTFTQAMGSDLHLVYVEEEPDLTTERVWNIERYERMAYLRNLMLHKVRELHPTFFLSLDSDILIHPEALANMMETVADFDAVGGKAYMTAYGNWAPSYCYLHPNGGMNRPDTDQVLTVDCIMAIKLMTQRAYNVDYKGDQRGEDVGWALNCRDAGVTLGYDARACSKHVMNPKYLTEVDVRCGY